MLLGRPDCRGGQHIELYVDGVLADTTTTDATGHYGFAFTAVPPTTDQTTFAGSQTGVHPDRFTCTPSESRIVVVDKVKTASGPAKTSPTSRAADRLAEQVEALAMRTVHALRGI
jgi:hypothetical protein